MTNSYNSVPEQSRLDKVLQESPFPWWEWNIVENTVTASPLKVEQLGYDHGNFKNSGYQAYTELLHPEDYDRSMAAMWDVLHKKTDLYQVDYRIRAKDGSYHWYMDRGVVTKKAEDESPLSLRGLVLDLGSQITDTRAQENLVSLIREAIPTDRINQKFITICSSCRRMRSGAEWLEITDLLADFVTLGKSHGCCEDCLTKLYPEYADEVFERLKSNKAN